ADGTNSNPLIDWPDSDEYNPRWSPVGNKIAFDAYDYSDGYQEVWTANADGGSPFNVTQSPSDDFMPVWAPGAGPGPGPEPEPGQPTAEELLIELISDVETLPSAGVNSGQANALAQQLYQALRSVQGTRAASACQKIEKFIKDVDKKSPRFITFPVR